MAFEIEMILSAAADLAGYKVRCRAHCRFGITEHYFRRGVGEFLFFPRFFDRQNCGQLLVFDPHQLRRREGLVERIGAHRRDRHPGIVRRPGRQQGLVAHHRGDIVHARNIGRSDHRRYARGGFRRRYVDGNDACIGMRTENQ